VNSPLTTSTLFALFLLESQGLTNIYLAAGKSVLRSHQSFVVLFVVTCMALFVGVILAVFIPGVQALSTALKHQRTLLLVVPAPLLRLLTELREAAQNLLSSEDAARAGVQNLKATKT
jgi:hypothetical protein